MSVLFMQKVLPTQGIYCVARQAEKGFAHSFHPTVEAAYINAMKQDAQGATVFIAQASFATPENRKTENAQFLRSFFVDIDCGPGKPYATQKDAATALKAFVAEVGIPFPAVVSSGNGLYAYWPMTANLAPSQWKGVAEIFKGLCQAAHFHVDPSRTADCSSVLRPLGATHRKDLENLKTVRLVVDTPSIDFLQFATILGVASKKHKVESRQLQPPQKLNSEFELEVSGPPSSAERVAGRCLQVRRFRDEAAELSEPEWYAGIGLLRFCENGEALIHEWSQGYPAYSQNETQNKINQHKTPPTTCNHYGQINKAGCFGCAHVGKIKTPIVLGRVYEPLKVVEDRIPYPDGFTLTKSGIIFGEDQILVYPHDIYPTQLAYDESLQYETVTFKHETAHDGWKEFTIRSSTVNDPKALLTMLHDNHVQTTGVKAKNCLVFLMESYIAKLRARERMSRLYNQMGWRRLEDNTYRFVLGSRVLRPKEDPEIIGLAKNVPEVTKAFGKAGDAESWISCTEKLHGPDMAPFAFTLLCGFAAPLMHFTGFEGALICTLGESGIGKTLMAKWVQSIYGDFTRLMMLRDDTKNALLSRLGVYGSLPLTIDEVSNIDANELSELAYRVTQGRDKARLNRGAVEKGILNSWRTLAVVSSNHSLVDRLSSLKGDASAEINRVFEYYINAVPEFDRKVCTEIYRNIEVNYGGVGEIYLQYLVDNFDKHQANIDRITDDIDKQTGARAEERFWSAIAGSAIYAGLVAQKLGLIRFDVAAVREWVIKSIKAQRRSKFDQVTDAVSALGQFLDKFAGNTVIVQGSGRSPEANNPLKVPQNSVVARFEREGNMLYISRQAFYEFCHKIYLSPHKLKKELEELKPRSPLLLSDKRKVLTAGLANMSGAAVPTWMIDLAHPALGNVAMELVREINDEFKVKKEVEK